MTQQNSNQQNNQVRGIQEFNVIQEILQEYLNTMSRSNPTTSQLLARDIQGLCQSVRNALVENNSSEAANAGDPPE